VLIYFGLGGLRHLIRPSGTFSCLRLKAQAPQGEGPANSHPDSRVNIQQYDSLGEQFIFTAKASTSSLRQAQCIAAQVTRIE